uniref:Cytochrome b561 domain-containing protein n=1 Tax=Megaselia scalaris TaxID=36166 RepID=T1GXL4_MEGSC
MCSNWKVSKCCCFDLKAGSLIIAQMDLSLESAGLIITLVKILLSGHKFTFYIGVGIVLTCLTIIACLYLKKGIAEDNPRYFESWIISRAIVLIIAVIFLGIILFHLVVSSPEDYAPYSTHHLVFGLIILSTIFVFHLYTWIVVRSYKAQLIEAISIV